MESLVVILVNVIAKTILKACLVIIAKMTTLDSLTAKHVNAMKKGLMVWIVTYMENAPVKSMSLVINVTNAKRVTKPILIVTNVIPPIMDILTARHVLAMKKAVKAKNVTKKLEIVNVKRTLKEKIVTLAKKEHLDFLIVKVIVLFASIRAHYTYFHLNRMW